MRPTLIIHLRTESDHGHWLCLDEQGITTAQGHGRLQDITSDTRDMDVKVLVPTRQVLLTQAQVPSRQRQQILQALPYLLEEQIVGDIEKQHFAIGKRDNDGLVHAAVTAIDDMQAWLETLRQQKLEPSFLCPDVLALPWRDEGWSACAFGGQTLVRTGPQSGFSCDDDNLPFYLEQLAADERPPRLHWHVCRDSAAAPAASLPVPVDTIEHEQDLLALMANELASHEAAAINLLQGPFSRHQYLERLWQAARQPVVLLLLLILTLFASAIIRVYQLSDRQQRLGQQIETLYRQTFPEDKRIVNPRVQAERHLKALRKGGDPASHTRLLDLLSQVAPVLTSTSGLTVKRMTYHNGILSLRLDVPTLATVDGLKKALATKTAHDVRIIAATSEQGRVTTTLELRPQERPGGAAP